MVNRARAGFFHIFRGGNMSHPRTWPWPHIAFAAVLAFVGVLLVVVAQSLGEWRPVVEAVGSAIFTIGTVSILYDYLFVRRTINRYYDLLIRASELQLDTLYSSRQQAMDEILTELKQARGNVKIAGIAATDFFSNPGFDVLRRLVGQNREVHLRFLLLHPKSLYAFVRAWIEEKYSVIEEDQGTLDDGHLAPSYSRKDFRQSWLYENLRHARWQWAAVAKAIHDTPDCRARLSVRLYANQPIIFLVAVNDWIYVEPFHWGAGRYYDYDSLRPCLGKRVVVLKFRRSSPNGTTFENHFDRLWKCRRTVRVLPSNAPLDDSAIGLAGGNEDDASTGSVHGTTGHDEGAERDPDTTTTR